MAENIEIEVRSLLSRIAASATRTGGMNAATYEALMAASAALAGAVTPEGQPNRLAALSAACAGLQACEGESRVEAA